MYIGPDTLMPIAYVFAAVAGFVLLFWRRLVCLLRMLVRRLAGDQRTNSARRYALITGFAP